MTPLNALILRDETDVDRAVIHDLTRRAFAPMPFAGGDEQDLIDRLRAARALSVSLVAELNGQVVGHVAFSPANAADGSLGWYALGPIAVEPGLQRRGIGRRMIHEGLQRLRAADAAGCILVGNPAVYGPSGFRPFPQLAPLGIPSQFFMIHPLRVAEPVSVAAFHPLFGGSV